MAIFSKKEEREERILVIDIDSSHVSALVIEAGNADKKTSTESISPNIIFSSRSLISVGEEGGPEQFLSATIRALKESLSEIFAVRLSAPDKIFCLLASPWYVSEMRKVRMERNVPFVFTAKLADEILRKEYDQLESRYSADFGDMARDGMEPIELKTMKTLLNGYTASSPLGKKARELELSLYTAAAPKDILDKIRAAVDGYFHSSAMKFFSSCFASFSAARDIFAGEDFLLVEVNGETTDVSVIKKGELSGFMSFSAGSNILIRGLAGSLGLTRAEAASMLTLYGRGHAGLSLIRKMSSPLKEAENLWKEQFEQALSEVSDDIAVPSAVVLSAEPEYSGLFQRAINSEQSHQYDWSESKFRTVFLNRDALHSLYLRRFV